MDKRTKAMQHLEDAERELGKALSTLGGKTRNKPRVFPPPYRFIARQYIESLIVRLRVTQLVLAERDWLASEFKIPAEAQEDMAEQEQTPH